MSDGSSAQFALFSNKQRLGRLIGRRRRVPMFLQTEANECGLACIAMVACFYGHELDLPSLRRRFATSLKGANLADVMSNADELGFVARPLSLELSELGKLKSPCILHWDLNHFVVLSRVSARYALILDPARGEYKLNYSEVSKHFTGIALELSPGADFRPVKERQRISLRSLTGSVSGLKPALVQILVLALALEIFTLVGPFYMQWVLDQALYFSDRNLLSLLGIGFLVVVILRTSIAAARSWTLAWLSATVNMQWDNNLFGHMLSLPLKWFEARHVGDVVSRFSSMQTIQQTLTTRFIDALLDGLMSLVTLIVMCFYSLSLASLILGSFAIYGLLRWAFYRPLYRVSEDHIVYAARQQSELLESIRGILPIKLANKNTERRSRYANAVVETINRQFGKQRLTIKFEFFNQIIYGVSRVILIWIAATMVLDHEFAVGMMVAFVAYADQFHIRAVGLIDKLVEFRMLTLHGQRLADIALEEPEERLKVPCDEAVADNSIEVRNLSFRYSNNEPWILRNFSVRIEAGESVAIIGNSGCGKTTLIKLILGLLDPVEGRILFGGRDIRKLGMITYRRKIGAVMQEDQLFAGTISDNIAFFDSRADHANIEAAARMAAVHEDILSMPMGYQTLVGDMGSSLSGGQKQRVILARAFYKKPQLLVLDEATSHLESERGKQINTSINKLDVTCLNITHRVDEVRSMMRCIVLARND